LSYTSPKQPVLIKTCKRHKPLTSHWRSF